MIIILVGSLMKKTNNSWKKISMICNSENQLDEKLKNAKKTFELFSLDSNGKIFKDFVS